MANVSMQNLLDHKNPKKDPLTVQMGGTIQDAATIMMDNKVGFLIVKDGNKTVGAISERDIVYKSSTGNVSPDAHFVYQIMTKDVIWGSPSDDLKKCLQILKDGGFRHLPIRGEDYNFIGVISERDITSFLLDTLSKEK